MLLSGYFVGIFTIGVFISAMLGVSHPRLKSTVTIGAWILLISVIMLPIVDIIKDVDVDNALDKILSEYEYEGKTDDAIEEAFEDGVAEYIAQKHGVDVECVSVRCDGFRLSEMRADRVYVTLSGRAALLDYKMIEKEIVGEFTSGGECEVSLSVG